MSLQSLPTALAPDQVEKLRWEAFGHKRVLSLKSTEDLVRFTHRRGFVLVGPQPGVHYPSVLEATVGRPLLEFTWDERATHLERWRCEAVASRRVLHTGILGGRPTLLAPGFLADFYALTGNRGDLHDHERLQAAGALAPDAVARYGPLPARLAPLAVRGSWVAVANVSGRAVVLFLSRAGAGWTVVGLQG